MLSLNTQVLAIGTVPLLELILDVQTEEAV